MRLLYGIQGTGNGHLARARALVPALRAAGLQVDFILTGRERQDYFNMEEFGDFRCFGGLSLVTHRGRLNHWRTLTQNSHRHFIRDLRQLDLRPYDLVLSDFEPLTAWAARLKGIPSIGVSHQGSFVYQVPKVRGFPMSQFVMRSFAPVDTPVGVHWHHFNQPILPPLIEPIEAARAIGNKILVYMGFEAVDDIIKFVRPFSQFDFLIYAKVDEPQDLGHIRVKPLSHREFHEDLTDCFGVISNAGFELASECLALGKKLLVKPLLGQFEQMSNALALQSLNRGTIVQSLDQAVLEKWLALPGHARIDYPDVAGAIARWIRDGRKEPLESLSRGLWHDCKMPFDFDQRFGRSLLTGLIT